MAINPGYVRSGEVRNPNGRPVGSKNKIGRDFHEAYEQAKEKYKHPYLLMMEWAHDKSKPLEVRAAMIKEAASYTCTKPNLTVRTEVPVLTSIEQAEAFLAALATENDFDPIELVSVVRHWIDSKREGQELQMKQIAQGHAGQDQHIHISGGLPELPGTNVTMPVLNGHNGHTIDHIPATDAAPQETNSGPSSQDPQP